MVSRIVVLPRSEEHTSELQSLRHLVCRLLLEKNGRKTDFREAERLVKRLVSQHRVLSVLTDTEQLLCLSIFFLKDPATPDIYPLPLHDALPIFVGKAASRMLQVRSSAANAANGITPSASHQPICFRIVNTIKYLQDWVRPVA